MGSVFEHISIEKASEALKVSRRQIYYHIKNGKLRTLKQGNKQLVFRDDVARIIEAREQSIVAVPLSRETVRYHESRIHMLEKRVDFLMRLHDLHNEPLNCTAMELNRFYEMALHCLDTNWSPQLEVTWRDLFIRIRLDDLEKLSTVVKDENPWLVFHTLCRIILREPFDPENKIPLRAGRKNLETLAYVWATTERKDSKDIAKTLRGAEKQVNKVARRVSRARAKN